MNLTRAFTDLTSHAINLILIRERLPELSLQVIQLYYEVIGLRTWYINSDKEARMLIHFEAQYQELRRRLNLLSTIYEFERIEEASRLIAC